MNADFRKESATKDFFLTLDIPVTDQNLPVLMILNFIEVQKEPKKVKIV